MLDAMKRLAFASALSLCACSSMTDQTAQFREGLSQARSENSLHASNCAKATSMAAMGTEMQRHDSAVDTAFGHMMGGMDTMSQCSCCDMSGMQTMMGDLQTGETDHRAQMQGLTDVVSSQSACKTYTDSMAQQMTQMGNLASGCMSMMGH